MGNLLYNRQYLLYNVELSLLGHPNEMVGVCQTVLCNTHSDIDPPRQEWLEAIGKVSTELKKKEGSEGSKKAPSSQSATTDDKGGKVSCPYSDISLM